MWLLRLTVLQRELISVAFRCPVRRGYVSFTSEERQSQRKLCGSAFTWSRLPIFRPELDSKISVGPDCGLPDLFPGVLLVSLSVTQGLYRNSRLVAVVCNQFHPPSFPSLPSLVFSYVTCMNFRLHIKIILYSSVTFIWEQFSCLLPSKPRS